MAAATSSLPVPLSPVISTDAFEGATLRLLHQLEAVHARHLQVGQKDVGREVVQLGKRLEAVGGGLDRVAFILEDFGQRRSSIHFVVDNEDPASWVHVSLAWSEN